MQLGFDFENVDSLDKRLIVSIFDYSGNWPRPYIDAGYPTLLWDYKCEGCILQNFSSLHQEIEIAIESGYIPYGLLAAPPCTDISKAGAQYWGAKDKQPAPDPFGPDWSISDYAAAMVEIVLMLKDLYSWKFWVMENPPGRLEKLVPAAAEFRKMTFEPCDFGDAYKKKTILWGNFNTHLVKVPVKPKGVATKSGNRTWIAWEAMAKGGGKSDKTKAMRSNTPKGFANAFFNANK